MVGGIVVSDKHCTKKTKNPKIEVIIKNRPSKEKSEQKIKELSEFLSKAWHMSINPI